MEENKNGRPGGSNVATSATVGTERKPLPATIGIGTKGAVGASSNPNSVGSGSGGPNSGSGSGGKDSKSASGNAPRNSEDLRGGSDGKGGDKGGSGAGGTGSGAGNRGGDGRSADSHSRQQPWKPVTDDKLNKEAVAAGKASSGKISQETVEEGLSAIFGTIAVLTNQTHWEREPGECEPIATPLTRMLNRMPAKQLTKLYELIDPAFLVGGIVEVAGPSVRVEVERFNKRRSDPRIQREASAPITGNSGEQRLNGGGSPNVSRGTEGLPTANAPLIGKPIGL